MTMYDTQRPAAKPVAQADNLTIAAFILVFFVPLVGAIMGHVSRRQAKRAGMRPNALATWAVWLGYSFTAITAVIVTVFAVSLGAAVNQAAQGSNHPAAISATSAPVASVTAAPPVTNPNGKYNGSCNYTLGSDPVGGTAMATGDIQIHNTGNVGTVDRLRITWPQQGYAPLAATKTIKLATGASKDVQFHRSLTQTELDNLQNWQLGHMGSDGCTYKATITNTFGPVS